MSGCNLLKKSYKELRKRVLSRYSLQTGLHIIPQTKSFSCQCENADTFRNIATMYMLSTA